MNVSIYSSRVSFLLDPLVTGHSQQNLFPVSRALQARVTQSRIYSIPDVFHQRVHCKPIIFKQLHHVTIIHSCLLAYQSRLRLTNCPAKVPFHHWSTCQVLNHFFKPNLLHGHLIRLILAYLNALIQLK